MATRPPPTGVKRKETTTRPPRVGLAAGTWGWTPAYRHCVVEAAREPPAHRHSQL